LGLFRFFLKPKKPRFFKSDFYSPAPRYGGNVPTCGYAI